MLPCRARYADRTLYLLGDSYVWGTWITVDGLLVIHVLLAAYFTSKEMKLPNTQSPSLCLHRCCLEHLYAKALLDFGDCLEREVHLAGKDLAHILRADS